jgi:VWFA-related protein
VFLPLALAVALLASGLPGSAQGSRGLPRPTVPEIPQEPERTDQPPFRTAVTRVEVSALVLDPHGRPVRGLTAADFEVLENGVPQVVRSFTPFTYEQDLIVLPDPVPPPAGPSQPSAAIPASNYYASASRVFALILDDLHVDARHTSVARAAARRLVDGLTPADLLFVTTISSSESTGYFTRDRRRAVELIDRFAGRRLLHKRLAGLRFPGHDFEAERRDHY